MPIYNHYYSRGYAIEKSSDGKHRPPSSFTQGSGYSTVGCSSGLKNSIIDQIESSSFMDFSADANNSVKSLYMYPRFSEVKGQRFAILGQSVTHKSNFSDSRPNYFAHNMIIGMADLKSLIAARMPEAILSHRFKDTYVDGQNPIGMGDLCYKSCIDTPLELSQFYSDIDNSSEYDNFTLNTDVIKAIIYYLTKANAHCIVCLGDDGSLTDSRARKILRLLYLWLPQKIMQNLGFITKLNSSKSHPTCNLVFCDSKEYRDIQVNGLGNIKSSSMAFFDATSRIDIPTPEKLGLNVDDVEYLNWLVKCIAGDYSDDDLETRKTIDEQELLIDQRVVPFGIISKIYKVIICQKGSQLAPSEATHRASGIASFALLNVIASHIPDCVDKFIPLISADLNNTILGGQIDTLIIDIDKRFPTKNGTPGLIDRLMPYLSDEVKEGINEIRIYKSPLKALKAMSVQPNYQNNLLRILEGAKIKYGENMYDRSEATYGYEMSLYALQQSGWSLDVQNSCKELLQLTFAACEASHASVFGYVNNMEGCFEALAMINLAKGKVTTKDCERIISEASAAMRLQPYNGMRRILQNTRAFPNNESSTALIITWLTYICKTCVSNNYELQNLVAFCKFLEPKNKYLQVWQNVVELCAQLFISSVAKGGDSFKTLSNVAAIAGNAPNKMAFLEKIAPALTVFLTCRPANESAFSKNIKSYSGVINDICNAIFSTCAGGTISGAALAVKETINTRTVEKISDYSVEPKITERYKQTLIRERVTFLNNACAGISNTPGYAAFSEQLGIGAYPVYLKSGGSAGVIENLYRAFCFDEDRPDYINARMYDMKNGIDLCQIGVFSIAERSELLYDVINRKGTDTDVFQAFSKALMDMYGEKLKEINDPYKPLSSRWNQYLSLLANSLIYKFGSFIDSFRVDTLSLYLPQQEETGGSVLLGICQKFSEINQALSNQQDSGDLCDEFTNETESNRQAFDEAVSDGTITLNPHLEIASLIGNGMLDDALNSAKALTNKLHQNRKSTYCADYATDERLHEYLKKNPKSHVAAAVSAVAVFLFFCLAGTGAWFFLNKKPVNEVDEKIIWQYTLCEKEDYQDSQAYITRKIKPNEISGVYLMEPVLKKEDSLNNGHKEKDVSPSDKNEEQSNPITSISIENCQLTDNSVRVAIAYERTIYNSKEKPTKIIDIEEKYIPVSGSDLLLNESYFDSSYLDLSVQTGNPRIYVVPLSKYNDYVRADDKDYPTLSEAIEKIPDDGKEHDVILLHNISVKQTVIVDKKVTLKGNEENAVIISRDESFTGELFNVSENGSLNLVNVTIDGGAKWELASNTVAQESNSELQVKLSLSDQNNDVFTMGSTFDVEVEVTNNTPNKLSDMQIVLNYDESKISVGVPDSEIQNTDQTASETESESVVNSETLSESQNESDVTSSTESTVSQPSSNIASGNQNTDPIYRIINDNDNDNECVVMFVNDCESNKKQSITVQFRVSQDIFVKSQTTIKMATFNAKAVESSSDESPSQYLESVEENYIGNELTLYVAPAEYRDARLSSFKLMYSTLNAIDTEIEAKLSPAFNPDILEYSIQLPYDVISIKPIIEPKAKTADISEFNSVKTDGIINIGEHTFSLTVSDSDKSGKKGGYEPSKKYIFHIHLVPKNSQLDLYNSYTTVNDQSNKGIESSSPLMVNYGTLDIDGNSKLRNNYTVSNDENCVGAVINYGTTNIKGEVSDNYAFGNDICVGAILNRSNAHLTVSDNARISDNFGRNCGGIYNEGILKVSGGKISQNTGIKDAGGIYNADTFELSGGLITENKTSEGIGGVQDKSLSKLIISQSPIIYMNKENDNNSDLCNSYPFVVTDIQNAAIGIVYSDKSDAFAEYKGTNEESKAKCRNCFFADKEDSGIINLDGNNGLYFSSEEKETYYKLRVDCQDNSSWEIDSFKGERMLGTSQSLTITVSPKGNLSDSAPDQKPVVKIYKYDDFIDGRKNPVSDDLEKLENGKYVYTIKELKADTAYEIVIE